MMVKSAFEAARWPFRPALLSGFSCTKLLDVFLLLPGYLDAMIVHRRITPSIQTHVHTWVERGTVRVK